MSRAESKASPRIVAALKAWRDSGRVAFMREVNGRPSFSLNGGAGINESAFLERVAALMAREGSKMIVPPLPYCLAAIDPNMSADGARRILESWRGQLPKLRPKARCEYASRIAAAELWLASLAQ